MSHNAHYHALNRNSFPTLLVDRDALLLCVWISTVGRSAPPPRGGGVTKSQINQRTKYTGNCKYVLEEFKTISQYSVIATKYTPICTEIDYCINESSLIS